MKANVLRCLFLYTFFCLSSINLLAYSHKADSGKIVTTIKYGGKAILLNEKALYVNQKLQQKNLGRFAFKSLQAAVGFAKPGTSNDPTIIYLEPDVYWTDRPSDENKDNNLIGMRIPQANVSLVGLSDNAEHTIIAGDRGQMAGAIGNWNTIGVGDGFRAYNVTFGNYCNVDLVYSLDPSKNHRKRQETITQAQVLTTANDTRMDKWIFENCRFISFLNVFAAGREPERAYFKNCFFQCTDDAIGSGGMSVFERCDFQFYANHPSWGGSRILQAYLGCNFKTVLRDPRANSTIFFAKNNAIFAVVDCNFEGNAEKLEWTDILSNQARHYVYNNRLNGKPASISSSKPDLSISLNEESLKAYKVGNEYNIYNLLRGSDDWDPKGQRNYLYNYSNIAYRLAIKTDKTIINGAIGEKAIVSYDLYPKRTQRNAEIIWTVSDSALLSFAHSPDGSIVVTGKNTSDQTKTGYIKGETASGVEALAYFEITGIPLSAPSFSKAFRIGEPMAERISVGYTLELHGRKDWSLISWYRAKRKDGTDTSLVAVSSMNEPYKTYELSSGDIGYYLIAKIQPRLSTSLTGKPVFAKSRKIAPADIKTTSISTDFRNIPTKRSEIIKDGFWTVDTHRPVDLNQDFKWMPATGSGWAYGEGEVETAGRKGIYTVGRGARMLYSQAGSFGDMNLTLDLSPQKAAGQGFGSATGQYLDIYIKFDTRNLKGYGLRIERTTAYGNGVLFSLYQYENGIGTPLGAQQYASAFLPGCQVTLSVKNNVLIAHVKTSSPQQQSHKESGLAHEVNLTSEIAGNTFGGFGVQHTGSTGGSRLILEKLTVSYD